MIARSLVDNVLSKGIGGTNHLTEEPLEALHYLLGFLNGFAWLLTRNLLFAHLKLTAKVLKQIALLVISEDGLKVQFFIKALDDLAGKVFVFCLNQLCSLESSNY